MSSLSPALPEGTRLAANVTHVIDQLRPGGAQHILLALARSEPQAKVCALHGSGTNDEMVAQFPRVEVLARRKYALAVILSGLVRMIMRDRAAVLFNAHLETSTLLLCLLRGIVRFRLVVTIHASQGQWSRWFRWVFRRVIFLADHVIVESQGVLEEARRLGLSEAKLTLIPIGTMRPPAKIEDMTKDIRREFGIPANAPIFLSVARMVPGKGHMHLVRAMPGVKGAVAVLVGDGPEKVRLQEEVRILGLEGRVFFAGVRTDLENFYPAAVAFVMPCLDESMGVVIYDALSCNLPVVAYASGSIGEIVTDGVNGYLLPPDTNALAAALRRVLSQETPFRFLAPENYSASAMVDRHNALYLDLSRRWLGPHPSGIHA